MLAALFVGLAVRLAGKLLFCNCWQRLGTASIASHVRFICDPWSMKKSLKRKKDTDCIATELCMGVHHCETLCSGDGQVFLCVCVCVFFWGGGFEGEDDSVSH